MGGVGGRDCSAAQYEQAETGGVTLIAVALNVGWLWGVASYGIAGNALGAIAALVVPPVGVLHTIGVI